ncbi:ER membrane protein complex subunit 6-like [Pomacea canaliculata]|uniref:ER membrane protein complex subunit 6-like n=1 Tax=Pomacea canaliculata TaxID=400727 RepID=UPI000D73B0BD|nr:ER membrane protein complex subunit 6-like [Pomacea canaliculata]
MIFRTFNNMASIGGIAVKPQKKSRRSDSVAYSELSLRQNAAILEYCRTSMSALAGATAGIMGLTSLLGFVFYFVSAFVLSVFLTIKAGSRWNAFFISRKILFISGLFGGLFTYILFWTFLYGMVHVY